MNVKEDQASKESFSSDTPQQESFKQFSESFKQFSEPFKQFSESFKQFSNDGGQVRQSLKFNHLHLMMSDIKDTSRTVTFGRVLHAEDLGPKGMISDTQRPKTQFVEEISTPNTSISNHTNKKISESELDIADAISPHHKKRSMSMHDMSGEEA